MGRRICYGYPIMVEPGKDIPKPTGLLKTLRVMLNVLIGVCALLGIGIFLVQMDTVTILSTFTVQSNLLCVAAAVLTLTRERAGKGGGKKPGGYRIFKGMTLTSILLTFTVTALLLKPFAPAAAMGNPLADNLLHVVVPLLMFVDFVAFEEKGTIKAWHPASWAVFPLYYVGYTAVYRALGGVYKFGNGNTAQFPYFFFDYETYGVTRVGIWFLFITIGFIGFSYVLFGFDRALAAYNQKRKA